MTPRIYVNRVCAQLAGKEDTFPGLTRAARAVFLSAEPGQSWEKHAVLERIATPDRMGRFSVPWMDDSGAVRVSEGYYAMYGSGAGHGAALFRPGLTADDIACRAFYEMLTCALTGEASCLVCGADIDASRLSDAESMRFCRRFAEKLPRAEKIAVFDSLPERERGYLTGRSDEKSSGAAGFGVCCMADEALRRREGVGLCGRSLAVLGQTDTALAARKTARRMGARIVSENADVWLLCGESGSLDPANAARIAAGKPDGVFEGAHMACTPDAAAVLENAGVLFVPSVAAGAGAAIRRILPDELSDWEAQGYLRRAMAGLLDKAEHAGGARKGSYAAAVGTAADALIRRGI